MDSHDNATRDIAILRRAAQFLADKNIEPPDLADITSMPQALKRLNAHYMANGLESLRTIPDASVDLIFSQAVMEHVRYDDFSATLLEMRRILKPSGVASHWIDFRDHLQDGLNNLRFSHRVWERFHGKVRFLYQSYPMAADGKADPECGIFH